MKLGRNWGRSGTMSEWKIKTLSTIMSFSNGKKRPKENGIIPIYGGNGILGYANSYNYENCVIVGRVGVYCGSVNYEKSQCWVSDNAIAALPLNDNDIRFIYYLLKNLHLNEHRIGTSQPLLTQSILNNIKCYIPEIYVQRKIASILSAIDDKIEKNTAINDNLEQQAQAIFKAWFVDLEPFGGGVPVDWKCGNLLNIADYLNGLAMQKYRPNGNEIGLPVLKIKELRQGSCDENSELCSSNIKSEYIVKNGDVIFSWSGSLLVDIWCGGKCGLNQHLFKVTSEKYDKWFYYMWTKYHLEKFIAIATDMATTMGHIKRNELEKAEVYIPNSKDYQTVNERIKPLIDLIITNRIENTRLSALRDTLLPKLMNGEIDVSAVKI